MSMNNYALFYNIDSVAAAACWMFYSQESALIKFTNWIESPQNNENWYQSQEYLYLP
jgi:hypothetical protein